MIRLSAPLLLVFLAIPAAPAATAERSVAKDADRCLKDPRFRVGGAAIGDCLLELSMAVDLEIEAAISTGEKRYCLAEDRVVYAQIQTEWQSYRQTMCDLVERSPDNTPSWVNGAACRLELGRQRLAALRYTNEYGAPRCAP